MVKNVSLSAIALLVIGVSATVQAENVTTDDVNAKGTGWWVSAATGLGLADGLADTKGSSNANLLKLDGGYDFSKYWGLYSAYGYSDNYADSNLHNVQIGVKGNRFITDNFSFFGKLGGGYLYNDSASNSSSDFSKGNTVLVLGAGVEYQLTNAISTKLGYEYIPNVEMEQTINSIASTKDVDLHQLYWGLTYKFGQPDTSRVITKEVEVIKEVLVDSEVLVPGRSNYLIPFSVGQSNLSDYSTFNLTEIVKAMQENALLTANITGRTDITGSKEINEKLSFERASTVAQYLTERGIDPSRLSVDSVSDSNPLSDGSSPIERSVKIILK